MDPSRAIFYRIVGIVSFVKLVTMFIKERRGRLWDLEKNFDWYRQTYPELVGDSWVQCFNCSGRSVHIRDMGRTIKAVLNSHVCGYCGQELYRTKTAK